MSGRQSTWSVIASMEPDLANIERWGMVLRSMGTSDGVSTEAIFVVGIVIGEMGERLRTQFEAALEVARAERAA